MSLNADLANLPIKFQARRRYLALVFHLGKFEIRAPAKLSQKKIQQWLLANQTQIQHYINQKQQSLQSHYCQFGKEGYYHINQQKFSFAAQLSSIEAQQRWLQKTLMAARDEWLVQIIQYCQQLNCVDGFTKLHLRKTKSKWGHCTQSGTIQLNWQLRQAPLAVQQYVIAHEVAHLRHMNHSAQFWQTVEILMPDYQLHRQWLKVHGYRLHW